MWGWDISRFNNIVLWVYFLHIFLSVSEDSLQLKPKHVAHNTIERRSSTVVTDMSLLFVHKFLEQSIFERGSSVSTVTRLYVGWPMTGQEISKAWRPALEPTQVSAIDIAGG